MDWIEKVRGVRPSTLWALVLGAFLGSPFLVVLFFGFSEPLFENLIWEEFFWALRNSLAQVFLSGFLTLALGTPMALGLLRLPHRLQTWIEFFLMLPSLLPGLAVILMFFQLVDPFPLGLWGIVLIQGGIYSGFFAVLLARFVSANWTRYSELGWMLQLKRQKLLKIFFRQHGLGVLRLLLPILAAIWTSFTIPFIAGGGRSPNLEILIYEKMRLHFDLSSAAVLSLLQSGIFLFLMFADRWSVTSPARAPNSTVRVLPWIGGQVLIFAYIVFLITGLWWPLGTSFEKFFSQVELMQQALRATPWTLLLSVASGLWVVALLAVSAWAFLCGPFFRLSMVFLGFGVSVTGFAFWTLGLQTWPTLGFVLGWSLLAYPSLVKMGLLDAFQGLKNQLELARTFGKSEIFLTRKILWPQLRPLAWQLAGLAALWASGDFALSRFLFSEDRTLALLSQTLTSSYRIDLGFAVMQVQLLVGACVYIGFLWVSDVCRRRISH